MHCHHEKTIVIDDRVAFVGGIDLTVLRPATVTTPASIRHGRQSAGTTPVLASKGQPSWTLPRALPDALARGDRRELCLPALSPRSRSWWRLVSLQIVRTVPELDL